MQTNQVEITGMTCDGCVRTVRMILEKQPGVQSAVVTLSPSQAEVSFDENVTSLETLNAVVSKMGYAMKL